MIGVLAQAERQSAGWQSANWHDANWQYLLAAIKEAGSWLTADPGGAEKAAAARAAIRQRLSEQAAELRPAAALDRLCAAFELSHFERLVLLLCAGMELDPALPGLCAAAQGSPQAAYLSFGLALSALPGAHWSAVAPYRPLRAWRLLEIDLSRGLANGGLRIDERILHYLAGLNPLDDRLAGLVRSFSGRPDLSPSQAEVARRMSAAWADLQLGRRPLLLQVIGPDLSARQACAAQACEQLGLELFILGLGAIPTAPSELYGLQRLWEREACLAGRALLVELEAPAGQDLAQESLALRLAEALEAPLILSARQERPVVSRPGRAFLVGRPNGAESLVLWRDALAHAGLQPGGLFPAQDHSPGGAANLPTLASQFSLSAPQLQAALGAALAAVDSGPRAGRRARLRSALWEEARSQARPLLGELAERIEPRAAWDDLVLPGEQKKILEQVAIHVRQRFTVYESWGFARRLPGGLGVAALFTGASGTGKTLAAEVLAGRLGLDLYRIDLSQVVSKYIGETEKNLRQVFDSAEAGGAILFFDEADALFGKRSEVKDSHDRYANIEISYLLQRMEAYRGLAILASNMKEAMDPAFVRRLRFIVHFPVPDLAERVEIWRRIFPPQLPTRGLAYDRLARLNVTGGSIRNIALHAAFLAAEAGEDVQMGHLLEAARGEYGRLERTLTDGEIRGWL